jgi:hypothetical protein
VSAALLGVVALPSTARAQYPGSDPKSKAGIAEDYHIEASYAWWNANPDLFVNSESLDILGTNIDLINDLGIEQHKLGKLDLVLKPAKKHRLRYQYLPIKYETDAFRVTRGFVFNGQRYTVGLPVTTSVISRATASGMSTTSCTIPSSSARVSMKLTNVNVDLQSPIGVEFQADGARFRRSTSPGAPTSRRTFRSIRRSRSSAFRRASRSRSKATAATTTSTPRDLQHQQVCRRPTRLAQDDDLLIRSRQRRPEVHGDVFWRGSGIRSSS